MHMYQTWGQIHINEYKYVFENEQILSFKYFESIWYTKLPVNFECLTTGLIYTCGIMGLVNYSVTSVIDRLRP